MLASSLPLVEVLFSLGAVIGEEGCAIPLAPGEPSAEWRKKHSSLTATPFLPVIPQDICIQTSILLCPFPLWTARQADINQITFSPPRVGAFSPTHPAQLPLCGCQRRRSSPGAPRGGKVAILWLPRGADPRRISAWPAGMGSVSSVLARSRNTIVQPGSSPPQPEVPLAAPASLKDSRTQRRALGHQGSFRPSPAWEPPPLAKHSQQELPKLESAELSPVLRRLPTMSQSSPSDSPGGEFCGQLLPGDSGEVCAGSCF